MGVVETVNRDLVYDKPVMNDDTTSVTQAESFTCNQCMNIFEDRDELFKHIKLAHQQHVQSRRRFRCDQCQNTFKSMSGLRNHSRTHSQFFAIKAEFLNPDIIDSTVSSNLSSANTVSTNEDSCFTVNLNSKEEKHCDDGYLRKVDDIVTKHTDVADLAIDGSESICINNLGCINRNKRRRSYIPLPVRRSLLLDRKSHSGHTLDVNCENIRTDSIISYSISQESTINTHALSKEYIEEAKQNASTSRTPEVKHSPKSVKTKLTINSPFGKIHTQGVAVLRTPKSKSQSRLRTSKIKTRTPNGGTVTPNGAGTLNGGRKTPNGLKLTPHKGIQSSGKLTPGGSKKDSFISKVYNCKKCGKSFVDKSKLDVHFVVHVRETPEKCGISKHSLKKTPVHTTMEFPGADRQLENNTFFSSKLCARAFDNKLNLSAHMKNFNASTPFSCDYCDKKFRFFSSLKAHSFVHIGESNDQNRLMTTKYQNNCSVKPDLDEDSSKKSVRLNIFSIPSTLVNQGENQDENNIIDIDIPFACKVCDYKTRAPAELLTHIKSHSKSGSYKCTHCNKTYRLQKNLKTHEKVHTLNRLKHLLMDNTINSMGTN